MGAKDAAVKTGIQRADQNKPLGTVSKDAEVQRAAEAAYAKRQQEIQSTKK